MVALRDQFLVVGQRVGGRFPKSCTASTLRFGTRYRAISSLKAGCADRSRMPLLQCLTLGTVELVHSSAIQVHDVFFHGLFWAFVGRASTKQNSNALIIPFSFCFNLGLVLSNKSLFIRVILTTAKPLYLTIILICSLPYNNCLNSCPFQSNNSMAMRCARVKDLDQLVWHNCFMLSPTLAWIFISKPLNF